MVKTADNNKLTVENRIEAFIRFGKALKFELELHKAGQSEKLSKVINQARNENTWFTERNIIMALENWLPSFNEVNIKRWLEPYILTLLKRNKSLVVSVVNAGNIPFVGFHDMLSVLACGHKYVGKNASGDTFLLPFLATELCKVEPAFRDRILFVQKLDKMDAVLATGNNNSSRYFEYYFKKYPNIIRKNRNGIAVLKGDESREELILLGKDIFSYFGLGCRNVSKVFVPSNYDFKLFFESMYGYNEVMLHNKYMNNFDYNNSVYLLKRIPFLQNGFLILTKDERISSPVSVIYYEEYDSIERLTEKLKVDSANLQCIVAEKGAFVTGEELDNITVGWGESQMPALWDYADGVNTLEFLSEL